MMNIFMMTLASETNAECFIDLHSQLYKKNEVKIIVAAYHLYQSQNHNFFQRVNRIQEGYEDIPDPEQMHEAFIEAADICTRLQLPFVSQTVETCNLNIIIRMF